MIKPIKSETPRCNNMASCPTRVRSWLYKHYIEATQLMDLEQVYVNVYVTCSAQCITISLANVSMMIEPTNNANACICNPWNTALSWKNYTISRTYL
jgi:hypothetical protein